MKRNVIRRKPVEPKSGADNDSDSRDGGVQSVDRALSIIEVLAEDDEATG
jgi:IclR family acetate operon transcriptional repressor